MQTQPAVSGRSNESAARLLAVLALVSSCVALLLATGPVVFWMLGLLLIGVAIGALLAARKRSRDVVILPVIAVLVTVPVGLWLAGMTAVELLYIQPRLLP